MEIWQLRKYNHAENFVIAAHGRKRLFERNIRLWDVMSVIEFGEIIEQYPDDTPFPSCLILGTTPKGRHLHTVVSLDGEWIYLITAYEPDPNEWESDMMTRREER